MATEQKKPRKQRIDWTDVERTKVMVAYDKIFTQITDTSKRGWKVHSFLKAQEVLPEARRLGETASVKFYQDFMELKQNGELQKLVPEQHDHRPAAERGYVKKDTAPVEEKPQTFAPAAPPVPISISQPSSVDDPVQMIARGLTALVAQTIRTEVQPLIQHLVSAMNSKMDDQFIRLLEYWDPEAAKQVREGKVSLPSMTIDLSTSKDVPSELATLIPPAPTPAPLPKKKVLVVGGKEDGFWSYLQDCLPDCVITFADGHKPKSIPTGKAFDYVLVHWMTSHSARAVIKNYYPDHEFMSRGGQTTVIDMISAKLGVQKKAERKTT